MKRSIRSHKKKFFALFHRSKPVLLFCIGGAFLFAGILVLWASFIKLPDFAAFQSRKVAESTKIYDRTGEILLYDVHQEVKRTIVPFEDISPWIKSAAIAIEDSRFYEHGGISFRGIARAVLYGGTRGGGSTITQQVIKKTLLTDEKLITRKIKEIILSFKLEQSFTKDEILALYLNEIPYGGSIYGLGEASMTFFGKKAKDLSLAESAYLAAIPNAPTYYSPYGNHRDKLDERKNLVLRRMHDLGFINAEEYASSQKTKVDFLPKEPVGIRAPHFVEWIKEYLANKYGELAVEENGYKVITTLDYALQKTAEDTITKFAPDMEEKFGAKNMALVAIDPRTGQVLSMVGARDYFDTKNDGNFNVALALRQPGSTFKPFAYATAFKKGYTPETVLFDLPTNFSVGCDWRGIPLSSSIKKEDCYMPENYEGGYRGPLTMRSSLAQSRNITSVKTLYLAGLSDTISTAKQMGITSLGDTSRFGLSLVLGGGEVQLYEITGAYGAFANEGEKNESTPILRIEDKTGNVIEEFAGKKEQVLPVEVARQITSILSDNEARSPTFGPNSNLYFKNKDVAVKTGTTNDYRDVWTVGYTPSIVVGMWAGNNDNSPIKKGNSAAYTVTNVWRAFMLEATKNTPPERFTPPEKEDLTALPAPLQGIWKGGEKYVIDISSGKLATPLTPLETRGGVVVPEVHTILHWVNKGNPRGTPPVSPQNDPQYYLWEDPVRMWVSAQGIAEGDRSVIPNEYDDVHTPESSPQVSLSGLDFSTPKKAGEPVVVSVSSMGRYPVSRVELFMNGEVVGKKTSSPFVFSFIPSSFSSLSNTNTIDAVVYDAFLNKGSTSAQLIVE
ncbi:MAG: transglycosylase domain-containing protein [bacterium]|nr:transglycosylase domain-containing protein [bacterium]